MNHVIQVSFVPDPNDPNKELVHADPNPLPDQPEEYVRPGDTVTWFIESSSGERELQVLFQKYGDFPLDPKLFQPTNPLGPFTGLALGASLVVGTIRSDVPQDVRASRRFYYKLIEDGVELEWDNSVGPDQLLGGGIDIPKTPPQVPPPPSSQA